MASKSASSNFACYSCRKFKCKCDGRKPVCSTCARTKRECEYSRGERRSGPRPGRVRYLEKRVLQLGRKLGMSASDFAVSLNKRVFEDSSSSSPSSSSSSSSSTSSTTSASNEKRGSSLIEKDDRHRLVKLFIQNFTPLCHLKDPPHGTSNVAFLDPERTQCPVLFSAMALGCLFDDNANKKEKSRHFCSLAYNILNGQETAFWEDLSMMDGVYTVYAWTLIGYFELICCRFQQATQAATQSNRIACLYGLNRLDTCFSEFRTRHRSFVRTLDPSISLNSCRFVFWVNIQLNEMMDASLMRELFTPCLTFVETSIPLSETNPGEFRERAVDWLELLRAPLAYLSENASMGEIFSCLRAVVAAFHTLGRKRTLTKIEISWWWWRFKTLESAVDGFQLVLDNDFDYVCNLAVNHHSVAVKLLPYRAFLRLTSLMLTVLCNRLGLQRSTSLSIFSSFDLDKRAEHEIRVHVELCHLIDKFMLLLFQFIQSPSLCYPLFLGLQFFHPLYQVALTQEPNTSSIVSFLGSCTIRLAVVASTLAKKYPLVMSLLQPLLKDIARKSPNLMSSILTNTANAIPTGSDCLNVSYLRKAVRDAKTWFPSLPLELRDSLVKVTALQYKVRPESCTLNPTYASSTDLTSITPQTPNAPSVSTSTAGTATPDLYPYFSWNLNPIFSFSQSPESEPHMDPYMSTLLSLPPLPCDPNFLEPGVMPNAVEAHCSSHYSEPLIMTLPPGSNFPTNEQCPGYHK